MGTWATDSFGNDDAADWLAELEEQHDLSLITETLNTAFQAAKEYLEAPEAAEALAAAEVVAAMKGNPGVAVMSRQSLLEWLEKRAEPPAAKLVALAAQVVECVLAEDSELRELWEESDEFEDWEADVMCLAERLTQ